MIRRLAYYTVLILVFVSKPSFTFAATASSDNTEIVFDFDNPALYAEWGKTNHNFSGVVQNGELICTVQSDNESGGLYFVSPPIKAFSAGEYPIFEARIKTNKNYMFDLYWFNDSDNTWVGHNKMFQLTGDRYYRNYVVDLSKAGNWRNTTIQLRLGVTTYQAEGAPKVEKGDVVIIDYIKFKKHSQPVNTLEFLNLWERDQIAVRLYNPDLNKEATYKASLVKEGKGKPLSSLTAPDAGKGMVEIVLDAKDVAPGTYDLKIEAFGPDGVKIAEAGKPFEKLKKPVWLKTAAQRQINEVLSPWTAMKASDREISCWGRSYLFESLPFPSQIISQGSPMLTSPMTLKGRISAKDIEWGKGTFELNDQKDYKIGYRTTCEGNVADLEGESYVEFDGMMWFDFKLRLKDPRASLDNLYVEIPLKKESSQYYWLGGVGWDAYQYGGFKEKLNKRFSFMPYIAVCGDQLGITWFTESQQNWNYDQKNAIQLISGKDRNVIRVNLVNIPYTPNQSELEFSFGLQATPVKPWPKKPEDHPGRYCVADSHSGTGIYGYDKALYARYRIRTIAYSNWSDRSMELDPGDKFADLKKAVSECEKYGIKNLPYLNLENVNIQNEGLLRYGDEWISMPDGRWNPKPLKPLYDVYPDFYTVTSASGTWQDYFLWQVEQVMDRLGCQGVYLDCSDPNPCWNPYLGCGYTDRNGQFKPTIPIRANREFMKRLYLLKKKKPNFRIQFHMSAMPIMPTHTFADEVLDGEQYVSKPAIFELPLEKFRAEFMGQPWGIPCNLHVMTSNQGMPGYFDNEKALAFGILHGTEVNMEPSLLFFDRIGRLYDVMTAFGTSQAEFFPYWKNKDKIKVGSPDVAANVYKKGNEVLVVLSNLRKNDVDLGVELDCARLGLSGETYARNYLDDEVCKLDEGKFRTGLTTELRVKIFHVGPKEKLIYAVGRQPTVAEFMGDFSKSNFPPAWEKFSTVHNFVSAETPNSENKFSKLKFSYPDGTKGKRVYLGIEARLGGNGNPQGNGSLSILKVGLNGKELDFTTLRGKGNLVGKSNRYHIGSGLLGDYYSPQKKSWTLYAYSNFSVPTRRSHLIYRPVGENPFTYVFDITDLVLKGENEISLTITNPGWVNNTFFKTIAIKEE
ncbi:MAG: glycoside hydrolase domain-containing protein [Phycisphaerae bacterium]